jgi:hypothetical protein
MKIRALLVALLLLSGFAFAQQQYGNIRGVVVDNEGGPLPGATVSLESAQFPSRSVLCSVSGIFRFLNLTPGIYKLRCELAGFRSHVREVIDIRANTNFDFRITLTPATLEEQVTVVAVSPIVDTKIAGTVTNVTPDMLQKLPSARDPWVILQQVPGILVDRENVGGSASGQQSLALGRGGMSWDTTWNMDGVPITDMSAFGSPFYYDFDTFEEMTIITGGQNATNLTGGISINVVTKRGGNKFQTQLRTFFTNQSLQGDNRTQELKDLGLVGDRINRIMDYGIHLGGPIKKDRIWFWLGYGVQDIRRLTLAGYPINSKLPQFNAKFNIHLSDRNRAEISLIHPSKTSYGVGASAVYPPETTRDQTNIGPNLLVKVEDEHTFSRNLLLSAKIGYLATGFQLSPGGGMDAQAGWDMDTGMNSGSSYYYSSKRPSFSASIEGNFFKERFLGGQHELRFGIEYRKADFKQIWDWAGGAFKYYLDSEPVYAEVTRLGNWNATSNRESFFINDAWTIGRLTLNLGFRLDREDSRNRDASVPASRVAPELLPAVTYPGYDPGLVFLTPSPRLGFTYDLTGDGKTILRGNIARYGSQEGTWISETLSSSSDAGAAFLWTDLNGDNLVSTDELDGYPTAGVLWFWGFDPAKSANFRSLNGVDPNLKVEQSDEFLLGIERELFPDFSLSATAILRRNHSFIWGTFYDKETGTIIRRSDYVGPIAGSVTYGGRGYNYEYWTLADTKPAGTYYVNEPGYHESFAALEFTAIKRLSRRWMMNASFTYQVYKVHYGEVLYLDPTNESLANNARPWGYPDSDWMAKLSFLYQLPWGLNIAGFVNARQGFSNAQKLYARTPERGAVELGSYIDILVEKPGTTRLPTFYNADLSLTKEIRFKGLGKMTLCVDAFNVFNFAHDLSRYAYVNSSRHNEIQKILNPRVIRFGLRYSF